MAGVAGPMLRVSRAAGVRLLAGLVIGEVVAAAVLSVPAVLVGDGIHGAVGPQPRLWLLAAVCGFFGLTDLAQRTPHVSRQVPESLIIRLPPGSLGLAWGLDLGLLFTTQKAVSFIWVALSATIVLDPVTAVVVLTVIALAGGATIAVQSFTRQPDGQIGQWAFGVLLARRGAGLVLLGLSAATAVQAWHA
jgi:hypothetical protein